MYVFAYLTQRGKTYVNKLSQEGAGGALTRNETRKNNEDGIAIKTRKQLSNLDGTQQFHNIITRPGQILQPIVVLTKFGYVNNSDHSDRERNDECL